jgi:hypothetical protein
MKLLSCESRAPDRATGCLSSFIIDTAPDGAVVVQIAYHIIETKYCMDNPSPEYDTLKTQKHHIYRMDLDQ